MSENQTKYDVLPETGHVRTCRCDACMEYWQRNQPWSSAAPCPDESEAVLYEPDTQDLIWDECESIRDLLLEKNRKYGDSAINPVRIFSRADAVEQINVRIDDKISRTRSAQDDDTEDPELDLIGYLILKRVAKRRKIEQSE